MNPSDVVSQSETIEKPKPAAHTTNKTEVKPKKRSGRRARTSKTNARPAASSSTSSSTNLVDKRDGRGTK